MTDHAKTFRSLHIPGTPLVLPNAWDAASARIAARAGAKAVATTSAGVAWCLGAADGGVLNRDEALAQLARIVRAAGLPVTADIENGFGEKPEDVADTVRAVADAGAVGVNIEDALYTGTPALRDVSDQCERLRAVRESAGDAVFINARTDTFLRGNRDVDETVARAKAYLAAGADGIFVPGAADPEVIATLVASIPAPLNILAGPGMPAVAELAQLGVARVSLGSSIAQAAYATAMLAAEEAVHSGTYEVLAGRQMDYMALNTLMR
jgi:2-methylisocitrate lyase-like PEP mutase family enzyme